MRKLIGILLIIVTVVWIAITMTYGVRSNHEYSRDYKSYWELSHMSSSIDQKSEYLDLFISNLEASGLDGKYNCLKLKTGKNSFDENLLVLKSLQTRLNQLKGMDITSFEFQTAQQIMNREFSTTNSTLKIFKGIWIKDYNILLWNWVCGIQVLLNVVLFFFGLWMLDDSY
jgi:hypothetical protein